MNGQGEGEVSCHYSSVDTLTNNYNHIKTDVCNLHRNGNIHKKNKTFILILNICSLSNKVMDLYKRCSDNIRLNG